LEAYVTPKVIWKFNGYRTPKVIKSWKVMSHEDMKGHASIYKGASFLKKRTLNLGFSHKALE